MTRRCGPAPRGSLSWSDTGSLSWSDTGGARSASLQRHPVVTFHSQWYGSEPARKGRPAPRRAPPAGQSFAGHVLAAAGGRPGRGYRVARHRQLGGERDARRPPNRRAGRPFCGHEISGFHTGTGTPGPRLRPAYAFATLEPSIVTAPQRGGVPGLRAGAGVRRRRGDASALVAAELVPAGHDAPLHGARCLRAGPAMPFQYGHQVRVGGHCRRWPARLELGRLRQRRRIQHGRSHQERASGAAPLLGPEDLVTGLQRRPSAGARGGVPGRCGRRSPAERDRERRARRPGRLRALRPAGVRRSRRGPDVTA
jgi:hypothetical protein